MPARHPLPRLWLMTDERADDGLERALRRLPRGSGVVFRHYATRAAERRARYETVRRIARARGLILVLADRPELASRWRADGVHDWGQRRAQSLLRTVSVHTLRDVRRAGHADLLFLSPLFPTRSHPGGASLGRTKFAMIARWSRAPVLALGGVNAKRAAHLKELGAYGWAAIDAWSADRA